MPSETGIKRSHLGGLLISALSGGSGKTVLSLAIITGLRDIGSTVAVFKKGPDYIDAGWLSLAADRPCYNLDTYMLRSETVVRSFRSRMGPNDIAVVEGNRGLFDAIDVEGHTSSAELSKLLGLPVILCVDCTKMTRTTAALVSGCIAFDPRMHIGGVILNRVANTRHERILRDSLGKYCSVPILGAVPKLRKESFPERHMGLVPTPEHSRVQQSLEAVKRIARNYLDMDTIVTVARQAEQAPSTISDLCQLYPCSAFGRKVKVGVFRDAAFQFYYPENLEALDSAGAEAVFISPLEASDLPAVDALYIGGGFPETNAERLAANRTLARAVYTAAMQGMPIYAECGGLMYLGKELVLDGHAYPMAGVLPAVLGLASRPQGLGYTRLTVSRDNPYFSVGSRLVGHEFHYSHVIRWLGEKERFIFAVDRGAGILDGRDGFCYRNVLASYTHIHALGVPEWAPAFVAVARSRSSSEKHNSWTLPR
jgi:cobyrinic acid a,c-diamide synthase